MGIEDIFCISREENRQNIALQTLLNLQLETTAVNLRLSIGGSRGGRARRAPPHLPGILVFIGGSRVARLAHAPPFAWHPSF